LAARRALAALAVAAVSISFAAPLVRLAHVSGPVAAWWRLLVGSLLTLLAAVAAGEVPEARVLARALPGGVLLATHFALWFESLRFSSIASSTGIVVAYPVLAAVLDYARGSAGRRVVAASLLGAAGVAALSTPWAGATLTGSLLAFAAAAAAAGYFVLGRRLRVGGASTLEYTLSVYSAAFAVLSVYLAVRGVNPLRVPRGSIPVLVALGVVPMIGGHTAMNYALAYMPASRVTLVALVEPYGASLLGWLLLGERLPLAALPGLLATSLAVWAAFREEAG